ncbi:MAG: tRNA (adenosine(37)-N6)-threonylcarbamoyltransferase complex ATPase subunit type 1 TsaE [Dehalococcoidales bacterium]|nr:tRNA (adenosine(37)-N6)-threonylcarbamoyltransferase complex ATPase subunit type 1 TsaE [Dehalococcoidales bacterium]MDD4230393.1 tRNA (adenosine(37)-N6)-threonylcarbamoyltransferase complex ATPase subunit type 1 TsaE [Dehalococcoidales bacterium]MDD4465768.1 tRNA (adenosine(37)-N6)-threonylcarbamoyltransferase complex ATPase subunit type 1 TsaE [Dehalococcoidales bacterium]MDD5402098.1 tRNA (adenosine(37)-N6)-threonylcarbamoyltransferase complex ATPase subunit type 1 TsaE [Dehalococcoidales 
MANSAPSFVFISQKPAATISMGVKIGKAARPGDAVLLIGNLGAGKTCLTQGIARGLGITEPAQSPTFVLVREMKGRLPLYHIDLYRLEYIDEVEGLGIDEYLYGEGLTVIEWADKGLELMPANNLTVYFETTGEKSRELRFYPSGKRYIDLLKEIR